MRILVVDDHDLVRRGICSVLATDPALAICGEAFDGQDAVEKAAELRPDIVVMDISMPRMNGLEAAQEIKRVLPRTEVVIVSQHDVPEMVHLALNAGAKGYVTKSTISTELLAAIAHLNKREPFVEVVGHADTNLNLDPQEFLQRSAAFLKALSESEERVIDRSEDENTLRGASTHPNLGSQRHLMDLLPMAAYAVRAPDGVIAWFNSAATQLWGRVPEVGDTDERFCGAHKLFRPYGTHMSHCDTPVALALRTGVPVHEQEVVIERPDGSRVTVSVHIDPIRDSDGSIVGVVNFFHDITEQKRAERATSLLAAIVDCSDDAIISKNLDGIITSWNSSAERLFGYTSEEATGQHITLIIPPDRRDEETTILERLKRGERVDQFETVRMRKDGTLVEISVTISPVKDAGGRVIGASKVARNITERKQTESALRESEERFRAIVETTPECVKLVTQAGTVLQMNSSGLTMVGADRADLVVGKNVYELIAPYDRDKYRAFNERICRGEKGHLEFDIVGLQGACRHMETHAAPLPMPDGTVAHLAVTRDITDRTRVEKELRSSEERYRNLANELETQVRVRTQELEQRNAEILKQSEQLRELSNRLLQAQDEERRHIARELHDGVGQLLAALNMNLSVLEIERAKLSANARKTLEENAALIEEASKEIRTMSHLLHPPLLDEVGLESALHWYVDGFTERSKIAVALQLVPGFSKGLPRDLALSLFRIVQECLTNVHRHSGSMKVFLEINRSPDSIVLEVRDEGQGIPADMQSKISSGESSGVGLRGMRERVRQFGGRLEIRSDQGGTRIVTVLPLPASTPAEVEMAVEPQYDNGSSMRSISEKPNHDSGTILCIDDETTGLLPRKLLLESAGHRVIMARSGADGIRIFQTERVDAVILDYWMSEMKGTAVASELKRINPTVPIIVLSGMADLPGEAVGIVDQWLVKGTHPAEKLLDSISTLLERRPD